MRNRTKLDGVQFCLVLSLNFVIRFGLGFKNFGLLNRTELYTHSLFPLSFSSFFLSLSYLSFSFPLSFLAPIQCSILLLHFFYFSLDSALSSHMAFSHPSIVVGLVGFSHLREERREMWWWVVLTAVDL